MKKHHGENSLLLRVHFFFVVFVFQDRISLCSLSCPGTSSADQAGLLELTEILCLPSAGIKGVYHYWPARVHFFNHGLLHRILKMNGQVVKELSLIFFHWWAEGVIQTKQREVAQWCSAWDPSWAQRTKEELGSRDILHSEDSNICPGTYGTWFTILNKNKNKTRIWRICPKKWIYPIYQWKMFTEKD